MSAELLDKDLVQLKQKLEILQSTFLFFKQMQIKSITQDQLADTIENIIEPYLNKLQKVQGVIQ